MSIALIVLAVFGFVVLAIVAGIAASLTSKNDKKKEADEAKDNESKA
jgi:hypothetical protein